MVGRLPGALGVSFCLFPVAGCDPGPRHPPLESRRIVVEPAPGREPGRPHSVVFADLAGNGLPDIVALEPDGAILVHRFPGWERTRISAGNGGIALAVADMDGDGRQDLVSAGRTLAWYRNPGRTGEAFVEHVLPAYRPQKPRAAPASAASARVAISLPMPVATPPMPASRAGAGVGAGIDLAAADIDGDGRADVLLRAAGESALVLLLQTGSGRWTAVRIPDPDGGSGLALADLDGDGRVDIAGGGWYLSQGTEPALAADWTFRAVADWPPVATVATLDVDRDGLTDLALACPDRNHPVSWFRNPGPGSGQPWAGKVLTRALGHVRRLAVADMDGDGRADLAFAEAGRRPRSRVGVLVSPGSAGQWRLRLLDDQESGDLSIADVGGDGRLEMVAASPTGDARIRLIMDMLPRDLPPRARKSPVPEGAFANRLPAE